MMKRFRWLIVVWMLGMGVATLVVLFSAPDVGRAQSETDPPGQISTQWPDFFGGMKAYRVDSVDNLASAIAYNSVRGEYLIVWEDHYASEIAVYGKRACADTGAPFDPAIQIAHHSTYTRCQPAVAHSPVQDKYLVVFAGESKSSLPPYTNYCIVGQPVNGYGPITELGFPIQANTNHQRHPAIAYNSANDEFLVVWDEEQGTGGWHNIWAQRINAGDWSFEPGPVCIATGGSKHRSRPDVAYNSVRNEYLIAYTQGPITGGNIYAKVVDAGLTTPLSITEFAIVYNTNLQDDVALAAGPDEYLAVWQDGPSVSYRTIYARRVSGAGTTPAPPFLLDEVTNHVCGAPDVSSLNSYGYLAFWYCDHGAPIFKKNIYGESLTSGENMHSVGVAYAIAALGDATDPAIACTPHGDCLQTASLTVSSGSDFEIYGTVMRSDHLYLPLLLAD